MENDDKHIKSDYIRTCSQCKKDIYQSDSKNNN